MVSPVLFANLSAFQPYLPYAVGGGVVVLVLGVLVLARGRRGGPDVAPVSLTRSGEFQSNEPSFADRRTSVRREGAPVKVMVSSPTIKNKMDSGYVLDRSTGGLRLALTTAVAPGSSLQVRALHAPDTTPWVTVLVRNCRDAGQHFELGCEFDKTPPWNVLLLFG